MEIISLHFSGLCIITELVHVSLNDLMQESRHDDSLSFSILMYFCFRLVT